MFTVLYQVAKNTFREALREPIFLLVLLSALSLIGMFPLFSMFVFRVQERLVTDSAMATTMLFGWGIAVLISSYAISREIDNGTALLLLSKPVQRPVFIIAKILGIVGAVTVFWFLTAVATLISLRVAADQFRFDEPLFYAYFGALLLGLIFAGIHNYVNHSSFPMMAVLFLCALLPLVAVLGNFLKYEGERPGLSWYIVPGLLLILFSVWAMASLATTLSTRFNLISNLLLCSVLFLVGLMSDYLLGRHVRENWYDTVPAGRGELWMSSYTFAPTEMGVRRWKQPERVDGGETFIVWSDAERATPLPDMGTNPKANWNDGQGWKNDVNALDAQPNWMATYDSEKHTWDIVRIQNERSTVKADAEGMDARFTSYVFRRSVNPPRTPYGGTYYSPVPDPGSMVATGLYAVIPNWQLFWMADALAQKTAIPAEYVFYGLAYAVVMIAFLMIVAILLFGTREVGNQIIG